MLLRALDPSRFLRLRSRLVALPARSLLQAGQLGAKRFASSSSRGSDGGENDDDDGDSSVEVMNPNGSGNGSDFEAVSTKVDQIQGALTQRGIPRPPVMLAIKVAQPVLPGLMHHMFIGPNDAAWIKAVRELGQDQQFYVSAFWERSPEAEEEAASSGGLEDIEQALNESQKTVDSKAHIGDDATSAAALAETARLAALTPAERQAAEQAKINAKLDELVIKPELDTLPKEKEKEEKEREEEEKTVLKRASKVKRARASASASASAAASLEEAMKGNGGNTTARVTPLTLADMQSVGTMCRVYWQQSVLTDAPIMLAMIGLHRVRAVGAVPNSVPLMVKVEHFPEPALVKGDQHRAYAREINKLLSKMFEENKSPELGRFLHNAEWSSSFLPDLAVYHMRPDAQKMQAMLETFDVAERLKLALDFIKKEMEVVKLQQDIHKATIERYNEINKKMMLMEQYKRIRKELGLNKDEKHELSKKYVARLRGKPVPKEAMTALKEQFEKLSSIETTSPEYGIVRTYLDWLTELPWGQFTADNFDLKRARETLDADHYGMEKVKERILEFVAVGRLRGTAAHGKILCLIGPPGVGKTSIGKSIARALDRQFYRIAVGGMHDISEIKGHRRTYIGAMPGKLVQGLKVTKSSNPVILIDEIDKIAPHGRHDPSAAMLEVLDPEQNKTFMDHYLDVPYDLSKVLFVCTANLDDTIPGPLADRMEFIRLSGYVSNEKVQIARQYLIPGAEKQTGVTPAQMFVEDGALQALIRGHCREAGVRNLQKHVEQIYRKAAFQIVTKGVDVAAAEAQALTDAALLKQGISPAEFAERSNGSAAAATTAVTTAATSAADAPVAAAAAASDAAAAAPPSTARIVVTAENLHSFVGQPIFTTDRMYDRLLPGVSTGLAWTSMGGSTLYTECVVSDAHASAGSLKASGHLKDVIRESCDVAYTVAKAYLAKIDANSDFFRRSALHLHLPEGGTPKDGPSAGITITCALLSLALNAPVRSDVAMTGEITLTGRVLPIGGVKEKAIGARRSGITTLIFPRNNKKDWDELPAFITEGMTAHFVEWYDEVFEVAFAPEVVKRAREARAVTRAAAISEFESEKKERAAAAAAPAVVELSHKSADPEAKKSGDSAADDSKPKRKPTFLVTPRWATVGTPPAALEQEWADLGADSPFTIPASPAAAAAGPVAASSSAPAPAAPVTARSRDL